MLKKSSIYESAPCLNVHQPNFLNAVLLAETTYSLSDLALLVPIIEGLAGRKRAARYGPRTLDIDILLYGKSILAEGGFSVPHCRISERAFVLLPLIEISGDISIPGMGSASNLLRALPGKYLVKTNLPWTNEQNPSFYRSQPTLSREREVQ